MPDDLVHLQTDELIAKLSRLTQRQVDGIARIVASGYLTDNPICPRHLLTGDNPICTPEMFYRAGQWREDQQRWRISPGWARQPAFMEALALAKRLSLRYSTDEEHIAVRTAGRHARIASPDIMYEMIRIARAAPRQADSGAPASDADIDPKSQVAAATLVLKYAALDAADAADHDNPESDWWQAAEEEA